MKQKICISKWLAKDYKEVYDQFIGALASVGIAPIVLNQTEEVWCRDFMPLYIGNGRYVGFNFRPDYLLSKPSYLKYITRQALATEDLSIDYADQVDLVLDGGNYVRCGDKVIITDKIFSENPSYRPVNLLSRLEEALQAEVILLPWDMEEPFGHADGMVSWLGDNQVLLNNYNQLEKGKEKPFLKRLISILDYHFDVQELHYEDKISSDSWCYLNYLETEDVIFLPALSLKHDCEADVAAMSAFEHIFQHKTIKQVFAQPLVKLGGALHCVTWEYYRQHR